MADTPISGFADGNPIVGTDQVVIARAGQNYHISFTDFLTVIAAAVQAALQFKDDGSNLGAAGTVNSVDFVGSGVVATRIANALTVTIAGGGGGSSDITIGTTAIIGGTAGRILFHSAAGNTADEDAGLAYDDASGQFRLATTGSGAGILIGGDALLYRSSADVLRTPDSLIVDGTAVISTSITTPDLYVGNLRLIDTGADHELVVISGENLSADRILQIIVGDAARTLTISGNSTINQNVGTGGSPSFVTLTVGNAAGIGILDSDASHTLTITTTSNLTAARTITLVPGDASRTLTLTGNATLNQDVSTTANPTFANLTITQIAAAFTVNGDMTLAENIGILLDATLSADGKYSGICEDGVLGETLAFGNLVYFKTADSRWWKTDADVEATAGNVKLGIVVTAGNAADSRRILLYGKVRADSLFPALTIGLPVYVGTTAGEVQTAQPSATDAVIRIIGYGNTGDELFFCPSNDYMTHT